MTTPFTEAEYAEEHKPSFPKAMITLGDDVKSRLTTWLGEQVEYLNNEFQTKLDKWAEEEQAYRALPDPPKEKPFVGACREVIPACAMAVDPIFARLDTSVFKTDRIIRFRALDKNLHDEIDTLERFTEYYLRHYLNLRQVLGPRMFESTKHGHMVLRVEYEDDTQPTLTYAKDAQGNWAAVQRNLTKCRGPKITGVPIQNFIYPPRFQHLQEAPIVLERVYMTEDEIRAEQKRGRMITPETDPTAINDSRTTLDEAHEESAQHHSTQRDNGWVQLFRFACKFDVNEDGYQESLLGIWDHDRQQILQLRYNWYFHQKYPYVLIPYSIANGDIGGLGLCEMILPFQRSMTDWHQQLWNNAYLANSRVIVRKKQGVATADPTAWYAGKEFFVDDPDKDVRVIAMADVHRSGDSMMQNLMGYVEKRTGVSDYLTGRESPIVGSRATATSTVALIQEGTKRVEETLENLRVGLSEAVEMCIYIWLQFGTDGLENRIFDEDSREKLISIMDKLRATFIGSSLSIDLAATDASNNKAIQQNMQLALIQTFTMFYKELINAATMATQAAQTTPALSELIGQIMTDAKTLYHDLAVKYDVPNPSEYLPDLEAFLASINASGSRTPTPFGSAGRSPAFAGMAGSPGGNGGAPVNVPSQGGSVNGAVGGPAPY